MNNCGWRFRNLIAHRMFAKSVIPDCLNAFEHTSHLYGLTSEWASICLCKSAGKY